MKIARLAGLMVIAIFAMSLMAASVATAEPAFNPASGSFGGTDSSASILVANNGVDEVTCATNVSTGTISGASTVAGVVVHFLNCTSKGETKSGCVTNSVGSTGGLIVTKTLDGVLGLILPKPATGTGVGLLLLPSSGTEFVTLSGNECTETTKVTGTVAGEATPIKSKQVTGKLIFSATGSKAAIKGFDESTGTFVTAKLTAFTTEASQTTSESIIYAGATEVT